MTGGVATLLALLGLALIVAAIRGTYSDLVFVVLHPAKGSEPGGAGLSHEPGGLGGESAPTHNEGK